MTTTDAAHRYSDDTVRRILLNTFAGDRRMANLVLATIRPDATPLPSRRDERLAFELRA